MMQKGLWINRGKQIVGPLPGVLVGDVFFFRVELCMIGLHGQVQAGIDYLPAGRSPSGEPIATSIIGDTIIYSGHGGRGRNGQKQFHDQKPAGGNLAMEKSMAYGVEVRVIRGLKCDQSPSGKVYVYDGLYKITDCWAEAGKSGFVVSKFRLLRIENQPKMGSAAIKLAEELKSDILDISGGTENLPISLFNDVDGDDSPLRFNAASAGYDSAAVGGCRCECECSDGCDCAVRNGGELPYDASGVLLRGRPLVYECGRSCSCPETCRNRLTQRGLRSRLEVFRTREMAWGVRPLELIRAGAFVCEFSGVGLTKRQSDWLSMTGDNMIYPNQFPPRWVEWGDISRVCPQYLPPVAPSLPLLDFSMDVSTYRNVACYLRHSRSPNVFMQFVAYGHCVPPHPHLMIFARESIPPLRELSIDYGMGHPEIMSQGECPAKDKHRQRQREFSESSRPTPTSGSSTPRTAEPSPPQSSTIGPLLRAITRSPLT
ncbi:unnamed protein product [Spirodela intermedia]|uniref:Uncharacterized protein n=1 Tax=Spirodela intermedia TaxID=51605 RepID=A0A7I8INF2_SPIIN|nr:unnamed protein product [Spirodela intermedia]CAA6658982.1 unnamed protein product [Spirodela intermedia]